MAPKKKKQIKKKPKPFMDDEDLEAEKEARRKAEEERLEQERIQREIEEELRSAKREKKKRDKILIEEEVLRGEVLQKHCYEFRALDNENFKFDLENRKEKEWQTYITCNHRPFPNDAPALNSFLYNWKLIEDGLNVDNILKELETILSTIKPVDEYLATPLDMKESTILNLAEAKLNYYNEIINLIDIVTFNAIMDINKYHERIGFLAIEVDKKSDNFHYWLWGWCVGGRGKKPLKKERPSRKSGMVEVTLPGIMEEKRYHMRLFHTSYDPFSSLSESYYCPVTNDKLDLYEDISKLRKMEIKALKDYYKGDYDEDVMPWWFVLDEEILAEKRAKEQEAKKKKKIKKKPGNKSELSDTSGSSSTIGQSGDSDHGAKIEPHLSTYTKVTQEKESIKSEISFKPLGTPLLYSRSSTDLMERRKNECKGAKRYIEAEPVSHLEGHGLPQIDAAKEDLFRAEKHTTFMACLAMGYPEPKPAKFIREITKTLFDCNKSDHICLTNERQLSDRAIGQEQVLNAERFVESIEMYRYGNAKTELKDGEMAYTKRDPKLRSIKELFADILPLKSIGESKIVPVLRSNIVEASKVPNTLQHPTKVSNVHEMREMENEILAIINAVWRDYSSEFISKLVLSLEPSSLNLREYTIIGGVYHLEFFEEEPQPFLNKNDFKMQIHYGEYKLKQVLFDQKPVLRVDLAVEIEKKVSMAMRKKMSRRKTSIILPEVEFPEADDDLIWISITLPENIMFIDIPRPVRWEQEKKCWTTDGTYDAKFKQGSLQFKLGKSGPFALSIYRFSNLPFQNFHIRPSPNWKQDFSVSIKINGRNFPISFLVKEDVVTIVEIESEGASAVSHLLGVPFKLHELVDTMRNHGLDMFPEWDSFLYITTTVRKLRALEEHMYYSIGCSLPAFEYMSSTYNLMAREDRIIVQVRECIEWSGSEADYRTVIAEPHMIITAKLKPHGKIEEDKGNGGLGYCPDLLSFLESVASKKAMKRMRTASKMAKKTRKTVISLIMAMKLLSQT